MALEDFFVDYGKQDRQPAEFVESVFVPAQPAGAVLAAYKVTKRLDEDITATLGAFRLVRDGDTLADVRLAFGGMAATPKRAAAAEAALRGRAWSAETAREAMAALETDFRRSATGAPRRPTDAGREEPDLAILARNRRVRGATRLDRPLAEAI